MKKLLGLFLPLLLLCAPAHAAINAINYPGLKITSPDTPASVAAIPGVCDPLSVVIDFNNPSAPIFYYMGNCAGTASLTQFYPPIAANISGINNYLLSSTASTTYFPKPTGTTSEYIDGTGALQTFPSAASRTFNNNPARALNTCFQMSATQDTEFHYVVEVTSGTLISGTATGTVALVSYTNSACSSGAATVRQAAPSQGASLTLANVTQTAPAPMDGILQAGKWAKLVTTATVGSPTFAVESAQQEVNLP